MPIKNYKILYHHRTLSKDGQNVHIEEMIKAFKQQKCQINIMSPALHNHQKIKQKYKLFEWMKNLLPTFLYEIMEYAYNIRIYQKLCKAIQKQKPDFIYERYNLFMMAGLWAAKKHKIPIILEVNAPLADERQQHGRLALYSIAKKQENKLWQSVDAVIAVTKVLAQNIESSGVDPKNIHIIHNGIDPEKFHPQNILTSQLIQQYHLYGKTILGFTGYIREWHRLDEIIHMIAGLKDNYNLHLLAVGDGPAAEHCLKLAADLGIKDRVTITGVVARDKVAEYIACFDIALQPAVTDYASPLKLFEYMALGKAIIAPNQLNINEILLNGHDSILFEPNNKESLKHSLVTLLKNPKLRLNIAKQAEQTIREKNFHWSKNAQRTIEIFETIKK